MWYTNDGSTPVIRYTHRSTEKVTIFYIKRLNLRLLRPDGIYNTVTITIGIFICSANVTTSNHIRCKKISGTWTDRLIRLGTLKGCPCDNSCIAPITRYRHRVTEIVIVFFIRRLDLHALYPEAPRSDKNISGAGM